MKLYYTSNSTDFLNILIHLGISLHTLIIDIENYIFDYSNTYSHTYYVKKNPKFPTPGHRISKRPIREDDPIYKVTYCAILILGPFGSQFNGGLNGASQPSVNQYKKPGKTEITENRPATDDP